MYCCHSTNLFGAEHSKCLQSSWLGNTYSLYHLEECRDKLLHSENCQNLVNNNEQLHIKDDFSSVDDQEREKLHIKSSDLQIKKKSFCFSYTH